MDGEKPIVVANIPVTKKHYNMMAHKVNTDKLRDMLREKCRIRVRELRHNKFDVSRQFLENEKQWLTDMLKGELTELEMDMLLEDQILQELIDEQYQWMMDQYDKSLDDELTHDPRSLTVLCPICEIAELKWTNHLLNCSCGFQQWYNGTLEDFWKTIQRNVTEHEERCVLKLTFFMDPSESALNLLCNSCNFLALIK